MAKHLTQLQDRVDRFDHHLLKTSIEIRKVPKRAKETKQDLFQIVQALSNSLDISVPIADIRDVTRLPSRKESKFSTVIIDFNNTLSKAIMLDTVKLFNKNRTDKDKLNSSHLGFSGENSAIYISEQLNATAKKLHYLARNFAKQHHYDFCWISNGEILLRKKTDSPYIVLKSESQLQALIDPKTV